jgi:class 3 adenylate cyclase
MTSPAAPRSRGTFLRRLASRSIRVKLMVLVGVLLGLGALNVGVYSWGVQQRARVFRNLQRAIERQRIITDVTNDLENQKKFVDLLGSGILGEQAAAPGPQEQRQFAARLDSITTRLEEMPQISEPTDRDSLTLLQSQTEDLSRWWETFYANQGVDATAAVVASVRAESIAQELLGSWLPEAVHREGTRLEQASAAFVETDRTVSRLTWTLFIASALLGGALAWVTLRDLFTSIDGLKLGAQRVGEGDFGYRIDIGASDELGEVAESFNRMAAQVEERTEEVRSQQKVSEELLLNILPARIAEELRENGRVEAKYFADTTILFADLVRFTLLFETLSVDRVVRVLDQLFTDLDRVTRAYGLEKLKTVGDAYMCVGGLSEGASHPVDTILAGFDMLRAVENRARVEDLPLAIRIGIHTGPVAAGVVGIDKFAFDLWGDTVNLAARLEGAGAPGRINASGATFARARDFFSFADRGPIETKYGRTFQMYFLDGLHAELAGPGRPPPAFAERYRIYFHRDPPAFPETLVGAGAPAPAIGSRG